MTPNTTTTPPVRYSETPEQVRIIQQPDPRERFAVEVYSGMRQISGGIAKIMAAWVIYYGLKV